ncbi:Mudr family transposase [Thalictrum thalictroides]|uniref:Mudr family transposase n=1 Tax=Thalictrum thalictroides TaxID=46969 RepID=A0A7J6X2K2_THATH|nr:Mudr family transposase [Thalictrum thalictroides]
MKSIRTDLSRKLKIDGTTAFVPSEEAVSLMPSAKPEELVRSGNGQMAKAFVAVCVRFFRRDVCVLKVLLEATIMALNQIVVAYQMEDFKSVIGQKFFDVKTFRRQLKRQHFPLTVAHGSSCNKTSECANLSTLFDADGVLFPSAFGIVDVEMDESWMCWTKGVANASERKFPSAFHGICMRHLTESVSKEFKELQSCAPYLESSIFHIHNEPCVIKEKWRKLEKISVEAAKYIQQISPSCWAVAYFEGKRFHHCWELYTSRFSMTDP